MELIDSGIKVALAALAGTGVVFFIQAYIKARKQCDEMAKQQLKNS